MNDNRNITVTVTLAGTPESVLGGLERLRPGLRRQVGGMTARDRADTLTAAGWTRGVGGWVDPCTGETHRLTVAIRVALLRSWGVQAGGA